MMSGFSTLFIYLAIGVLLIAVMGFFNIITLMLGEILGKPLLFLLHYSDMGPKLNIAKKGNEKRSNVQVLAAIMTCGLTILVIMLPLAILNGTIDLITNSLLILSGFIILPYARILWVSKKLPEQDIDKDYFLLKSPLSFVGGIIKKTIGL